MNAHSDDSRVAAEQELTDWIAAQAEHAVRSFERVGYGASRATFIAEMDGGGDLVARVDTGDGPMAGTELSLAREAEVYRALAGKGVRIPRLRAVMPDGSVLLTERAPGTHEVAALDGAQRGAVYDDFIDALAELHAVDVDTLDLPSYRRPVDAAGHATEELDLWGEILDSRTTGAWPLAHFALRVLRQCAPDHVARTVLCHGDVGPGNFMHDGARVTALLDWEFSHVGDPMDDLAWWVFRGHDMAGDCGDLAAQLGRWQARTGLAVDPSSIEFYRAMVMLRWMVSVASALDRGGPNMDRSVYFSLVPILTVRLSRSLAALLGITLPTAPPMDEQPPGVNAGVIEALRADLADVIAPAVTTAEVARRVGAALLYTSHLAADDRLGPTLRAADVDDIEAVTGARPDGPAAAERAIAAAARGTETSVETLVGYFWRAGHRQVAVWPLVAERALREPTTIPSPTTTITTNNTTTITSTITDARTVEPTRETTR